MDKDKLIFELGTIRRNANLSARALSLKVGMNASYINRLETQKNFYPSMEVFFEILDVCGYSAEKFFYHNRESFEKDMELLDKFSKLDDEKKDAILKLIK